MRSTLRKSVGPIEGQEKPEAYQPRHVRRLEVVDDFIRNFLRKNNMTKTLNSFQVAINLCRNNGTNMSKVKRTCPTQNWRTKFWKIRYSNSGDSCQGRLFCLKDPRQHMTSCWRREISTKCIIRECRRRRKNWIRIFRGCMLCRMSMKGNLRSWMKNTTSQWRRKPWSKYSGTSWRYRLRARRNLCHKCRLKT